jgi:hypothetical protein
LLDKLVADCRVALRSRWRGRERQCRNDYGEDKMSHLIPKHRLLTQQRSVIDQLGTLISILWEKPGSLASHPCPTG